MTQRYLSLAAVVLLAPGVTAQRPPDLKQLLPDAYHLYLSADGGRVRASGLWSTLTRTPFVGKQIQSLPLTLGIDVEDVDTMVLGNADRDPEERMSVVLAGKPALRASAFVDAKARSDEGSLTGETIGGHKAWLPVQGDGPGTADLGPGTLWLASPAVLRERLGEAGRPRPARPSAALEALLAREGGAVFVALDGAHEAVEPLQRLAVNGGLRRFQAVCARIELTPVLEADLTIVPDPRDDTARVKTVLQEKVAQGAEELRALGLQILAKQCARVAVEVRGRDVGCVFKLAKGQESALAVAPLLLFGVRSVEMRAEVVELADVEEAAAPAPVSRPASRPAPGK